MGDRHLQSVHVYKKELYVYMCYALKNHNVMFFPIQPGTILQARQNFASPNIAVAVGRGLEPIKIRFPNSRMRIGAVLPPI
jgi:hypothetical protein